MNYSISFKSEALKFIQKQYKDQQMRLVGLKSLFIL